MNNKPNFLTKKEPLPPKGEQSPLSNDLPDQDYSSMEQEHVAEIKQAIELIKSGQPDQALPVLESLLTGEESEINPKNDLKEKLAAAITG